MYKPCQTGAALILVLGIMAIISVLATQILDTTRSATRLHITLNDRQQALWYARAGEAYALEKLPDFLDEAMLEAEETQADFPFEEGFVSYRLTPLHACLNVNSLNLSILNDAGETDASKQRQKKHSETVWRTYLNLLQLPEGQQDTLLQRLADWADADRSPTGNYGAEAAFYSAQTPPYQPPNSDLLLPWEVSQLQALEPEELDILLPGLCARLGDHTLNLNPNDLKPADAPLLAAALAGTIDIATARRLLEERPKDGFKNLDAFWQHSLLSGLTFSDTIKQGLSLKRHYYLLQTRVQYGGAGFNLASILYIGSKKKTQVLGRRYGVAP